MLTTCARQYRYDSGLQRTVTSGAKLNGAAAGVEEEPATKFSVGLMSLVSLPSTLEVTELENPDGEAMEIGS
jgi:hypothetical protein